MFLSDRVSDVVRPQGRQKEGGRTFEFFETLITGKEGFLVRGREGRPNHNDERTLAAELRIEVPLVPLKLYEDMHGVRYLVWRHHQ